MTFRQRAELIADYIEASRNKCSPLVDDLRLTDALETRRRVYGEFRKHDFSTAVRESDIAAITGLLKVEGETHDRT